MGLARTHDAELWMPRLALFIKVGCACLIAASLAYLAFAGIHYAVISGLQIEAEVQGTRTIIAYSLVLFGLFLAAGVLGPWACAEPRRLPVFAAAALAAAVAIGAGVATSTFGVTDSAFDVGFFRAFDLLVGVLALALCAAGAGLWRLGAVPAPSAAAVDDVATDGAAADDAAAGEADAGDAGAADAADEVAANAADVAEDGADGADPADAAEDGADAVDPVDVADGVDADADTAEADAVGLDAAELDAGVATDGAEADAGTDADADAPEADEPDTDAAGDNVELDAAAGAAEAACDVDRTLTQQLDDASVTRSVTPAELLAARLPHVVAAPKDALYYDGSPRNR